MTEKDFNIDKKDWQPVKFGDVVQEIRETVKDPKSIGIDKIVGLEHIDSENIHLRNYENLTNGTTFTRRFRKGQVLFGRRRAYLKKAALAEFDGICSGDIIVMEAKKKLNPKLLPFIVNNDKFFDFAVKTSAGSLSPRTKYQYLAEYEFLLPPKEQQEKIAELLWAIDKIIESNKKLLNKNQLAYKSKMETKLSGKSRNGFTISQLIENNGSNIPFLYLDEVGEFFKGKGIAKNELKDDGLSCIRYGEIYTKHNILIRDFYSFISKEKALESFQIKTNDVLFAGSGETREDIGKACAFMGSEKVYAGSDILIFRPRKEINGHYLSYVLNSIIGRHQLSQRGTGATIFHIYITDLRKIKVPMIPLEEQLGIVENLENYVKIEKNISNNILQTTNMMKQFINNFLINEIGYKNITWK